MMKTVNKQEIKAEFMKHLKGGNNLASMEKRIAKKFHLSPEFVKEVRLELIKDLKKKVKVLANIEPNGEKSSRKAKQS